VVSKVKTVELPAAVVKWICALAENALYTEQDQRTVSLEETDKRMTLVDQVLDRVGYSSLPYSYHIAARDMQEWKDTRSSLSWMQVCGIKQTLTTCRADAQLGEGGLRDLDVIEELVERTWEPSE
jgi:hypothetical protein